MIEQVCDIFSSLELTPNQVNEVFLVANDRVWRKTLDFVISVQPDFLDDLGKGSIVERLSPFAGLADWEVKYGGNSIGVEKEMLVLDRRGELPTPWRAEQLESRVMCRIVKSRFPESYCYHDGSLGVNDITEVCTQVCDNIADLSDNLVFLYGLVKKALRPGEHIVAKGYAAERVLGTHVNLGAGSAEEACYLMNAFRQHLPELVSLSLNSGRIYYEGVCAEFPDVLDLSMLNYVKQFTKKLSSGLSDPIMLSPKSTVEIRCFDSQQAPEQDVALAAYTFAIHQYAREHFPHYPLDRPFLKAMYGQASRVGVEAVVNGNQVRDWIKETLDTVQPEPAYFKPLLGKI